MEGLFLEVFLIALLILLNGYLAGTEIAVVTARKSTIKQMAESGERNAKIFLKLKEEPDRFLATIQIGITTVGVLASAVGGAAAVKVIKPACRPSLLRSSLSGGTNCHRDHRRGHHLFYSDLWGIGTKVHRFNASRNNRTLDSKND